MMRNTKRSTQLSCGVKAFWLLVLLTGLVLVLAEPSFDFRWSARQPPQSPATDTVTPTHAMRCVQTAQQASASLNSALVDLAKEDYGTARTHVAKAARLLGDFETSPQASLDERRAMQF